MTSWHKDPYENLYCVVTGEKVFELRPPADVWGMRLRRFPVAMYACGADGSVEGAGVGGEWEDRRLRPCMHDPEESIVWPDLAPCRLESSPADEPSEGGTGTHIPHFPPPLRVTVHAGEVLYLPAHWWHSVAQRADASGRVVAVNYWHDARLGAGYAAYAFAERAAQGLGLAERGPG